MLLERYYILISVEQDHSSERRVRSRRVGAFPIRPRIGGPPCGCSPIRGRFAGFGDAGPRWL